MAARVSGFTAKGSWSDVVEHGERISATLHDLGAHAGSDAREFHQWDDWRPKPGERLEVEVNERTAAQACIPEGPGEVEGTRARDDIRSAARKFKDAFRSLWTEGLRPMLRNLWQSIGHTARAADSAGRKTIRIAEQAVYRRVMTALAPYYFDNLLVSANIHRAPDDPETFVFEIDINDDELKSAVADRLRRRTARRRVAPTPRAR